MRRMRPYWPLAAVTVLGLALRLIGADARLNHDEGYSWLVAVAPDHGTFLERLARTENTPPLFYELLRLLPVSSEAWLRWPSIVAGTAWIPATFALVRSLAPAGPALLAALAVAVAPFAVSYSDYSRAFMVAGLAEIVVLLAAVRLLGAPSRGWSAAFVLAAAASLYSEYYCLAFLAVVVGALLALEPGRWRRWLLLGALPLALFAPWLGEAERSLDNVGQTKLPTEAGLPTPGEARDAFAALAFGESGAAGSAAARTLQLAVVVALLGWALLRIRATHRRAAVLLGSVLAGVVVAHALASAAAGDFLRQRYLTVLIPVGAALLALAAGRRTALALAAVLVLLGGGIAVRRAGREYEPDHARAVALAGPATIHTNSAVIAFYGREKRVVLDRPFGMGAGSADRCRARCAVVDDARYGGVRPGSGPARSVGPIVVRILRP